MAWVGTRRNVLQLGAGLSLSATPTRGWASPQRPLRSGINIHHMLNWPELDSSLATPSYVWPPFQSDAFRTSDAEFNRLRKLGFDFIRLTVDPAIFLTDESQRQADLANIVDSTVGRILSFGFNVIVDLHPVQNVPEFGPEAFIKSLDDPSVLAYGEMLSRLARVLEGMPRGRVYFELINEPQLTRDEDYPLWQSLLSFYHGQARAAAAELPLILTGQNWGSAQALMRLDLSRYSGSNILVTFHYYDPHAFTHQGVLGQHAQYLVGLRWPPRAKQLLVLLDSAERLIEADPKLDNQGKEMALSRARDTLTEYLNQGHGPARVDREFARVKNWANEMGLSPGQVLLGEFGAVRLTDPDVNSDRLAWLNCVRAAASKHEFPWALWVYRGYGGMALADESSGHELDGDVATALTL
jgi:endoglucanase